MPIRLTPLVAYLRSPRAATADDAHSAGWDGLGAQLALPRRTHATRQIARVAIASKLPPRYDFLDPGASSSKTSGHPPLRTLRPRFVVVLDTGTGPAGDFGDYLKRTAIPASSSITIAPGRPRRRAVRRYRQRIGGRLAYEITQALASRRAVARTTVHGLATDTGWFPPSERVPGTLASPRELVALGANPTELYESCTRRPLRDC